MSHDPFGRLSGEWQEHGGAVVTSGPTASYHVQYVYEDDDTAAANNRSRLVAIGLLGGRQTYYAYDDIGRVAGVYDQARKKGHH